MEMPFVIYSYFESYFQKNEKGVGKSTKFCDTHTPSGFCCLTVSKFPQHNNEEPFIYTGNGDVLDAFFTHLTQERVRINGILKKDEPMIPLTQKQKLKYRNCKNCPTCDILLKSEMKIRQHCHVTGQFISALCLNCNLLYKYKTRTDGDEKSYLIPVVFHNLRGYDSHIIFKNVISFFATSVANVIATNMEKYISFENLGLRFIDSLQFINCSLETLVKNLEKGGEEKFEHMAKLHPVKEQFKLLLRKCVYSYDVMDGPERMNEPNLPPQDKFFSRLSDSNISDEDYKHAQAVWTKFAMRTMRDYHDLYLKSDVILLANVFEEFRKLCLNYYKLDPVHYFSCPGLSFDAMLKMTKVKLGLITVPDHYLFVERGLRGGVSMISNRYAKDNNKYLAQGYDETKESNNIIYLDFNNLYGYAMRQLSISRSKRNGGIPSSIGRRQQPQRLYSRSGLRLSCPLARISQ